MDHVVKQYDIQRHELPAAISRPSVVRLTNIGEAKVTKTIFGKAKVRINHEQDMKRRVLLVMTLALALAVAVVAAWEGWNALHQPEHNPPHVTPSSLSSEQSTQSQTVISTPIVDRESATIQALGLKASEQMVTKPETTEPLTASKPKKAKLATSSEPSKDQPGMQQPFRLPDTIQPATPTISKPPAKRSEMDAPEAVAPPVEPPLINDDTSKEPPPGVNQPPESVNAQP